MHTADCETHFSQLDKIKSDIKNYVTTETLNKLFNDFNDLISY